MDDIEIVIKISEKEYDAIKENKYGVFSGHIFEAIRNGRPLSERRTNEERWIPVKEKWAPEEGGTYLVTVHDQRVFKSGYGTISAYYNKKENQWVPDDEWIKGEVVAWMPMPEPYKVESEEKK